MLVCAIHGPGFEKLLTLMLPKEAVSSYLES